ncbi:MAG TPA: metallophosphoesterase [Ohtaekwangia sp.]
MRAIFLIVIFLISVLSISAQHILVPPYLQPGNASTFAKEQKVVIWETDSVPATFTVTFHLKGDAAKIQHAKIQHIPLQLQGKTTRLYRATLPDLRFDTVYTYEVKYRDSVVTRASFSTRTKKQHTRFAVLGDFGAGTTQQGYIAHQLFLQKPQFVLSTGDNVYQDGLASEYRKNLFPFYNADKNDPTKGAMLMNTIPFYMVLGNHDVRSDNLDKYPDGLAYFYYNDLPLNAPLSAFACKVSGSTERVKAFKKNTKPRFPRISNFSFDYGNIHFICLDANDYVNPLEPMMVDWIKRDIKASKAQWKIVTFHQPGFNSSASHYDAQIQRLLSPLFESLEVDLVLTGHVHNYQRSLPLKFIPERNETGDQYAISPEGRVNGVFTLDTTFDGITDTTPEGIIYIVTGAGGNALYDMKISEKPEKWQHEPKENWVPFTKKLISHIHSFTFIETNGKTLDLQQIDLYGNVIDRIRVTK